MFEIIFYALLLFIAVPLAFLILGPAFILALGFLAWCAEAWFLLFIEPVISYIKKKGDKK